MTTKSMEAGKDVAALLQARNPLLWIVTNEEARCESYLIPAAAKAKYEVRFWDCADGVTNVQGKRIPNVGGTEPVDVLQAIMDAASGNNNERFVWVLRDMPGWITGALGMIPCRKLRNVARFLPSVPDLNKSQAMIIISPSAEVPPELKNHATVIRWALPDREELGELLDEFVDRDKMDDDIREHAIAAAVGLSGEEAQATFASSLVKFKAINPVAIADEKKRVIAREGILEWYDPHPEGLDAVGGLDVLKGWFVSRAEAYTPAAREYGLPAPKGCLLVGVPGCLRGDTPIYDPVACSALTVRERWQAQKPFNVWSKDASGTPVIGIALPPKKYSAVPMLEFTMDDGISFTVTNGHRFISEGMEISAVEVYERLLKGELCQLQTNSVYDLQAQTSDALSSMRILRGYLDRCWNDLFPSCGAQPQLDEDIVLTSLPSLSGVHAHNHRYSQTGVSADVQGHIHPCLSSYRLSMLDYQRQNSAQLKSDHPAWVRLVASTLLLHDSVTCLKAQQSRTDFFQNDTIQEPADDGHPSTADASSSIRYTRVRAIRQVDDEEYFDFHVPAYENYWACGIWHHNCGKSLLAKAIASFYQRPLIRWDLGGMKSKFVGESEKNLRRAIELIELIGGCIVWLDEIEKALAGATDGSADGGVSTDVLGTLLSWMQERKGEAFVIATSNDVTKLPPELLRKGRFDELWFVDLPNIVERREILLAALRQFNRHRVGIDLAMIAAKCDGFNGSEIAAIVPDAMYAAFSDGAREITTADLLVAADAVTPLSKTAEAKITALRNWATGNARPASSPLVIEDMGARRSNRRILDLDAE